MPLLAPKEPVRPKPPALCVRPKALGDIERGGLRFGLPNVPLVVGLLRVRPRGLKLPPIPVLAGVSVRVRPNVEVPERVAPKVFDARGVSLPNEERREEPLSKELLLWNELEEPPLKEPPPPLKVREPLKELPLERRLPRCARAVVPENSTTAASVNPKTRLNIEASPYP